MDDTVVLPICLFSSLISALHNQYRYALSCNYFFGCSALGPRYSPVPCIKDSVRCVLLGNFAFFYQFPKGIMLKTSSRIHWPLHNVPVVPCSSKFCFFSSWHSRPRVQKVKDRELSLYWEARESALELDAWIEETHTLEEDVKYLKNWASNIGWKIYKLDEGETNLGDMVMRVSDNFNYFKSENSWDAIRGKFNNAVQVEKECEDGWINGVYIPDCKVIVSLPEDYYSYEYYYDRRWATNSKYIR